jgi:hypothetical protein
LQNGTLSFKVCDAQKRKNSGYRNYNFSVAVQRRNAYIAFWDIKVGRL